MNKCGWGRGRMSPAPARCPERPLPAKTFCARHDAEAMARVARMPQPSPYRALRWGTGGWMVSGRSTE